MSDNEEEKFTRMTDYLMMNMKDVINDMNSNHPDEVKMRSTAAIALALTLIAKDVHSIRTDLDEMPKITQALHDINTRLSYMR